MFTGKSKQELSYPLPKESRRAEKRDALYEQIDRKVAIIKDLKKFVIDVAEHDNDELSVIFSKKKQEIHDIFSVNTLEQYDKCKELKDKLVSVSKKINVFVQDHDDDFEKYDFIKLEEEELSIMEQINQIESDADVLFLFKLDDFFKTLVHKKDQVNYYKERYERNGLSAFNFEGDESTVEIFFSGYSVNIIFESTEYTKRFGDNVQGKHFSGTVFNVIRDSELKGDIILHEENHNITESFSGDYCYRDEFIGFLQEEISRIDSLSDFLINDPKKILQDKIRDYVYHNYCEILADVNSLEQGKIHTFVSNFIRTSDVIADLIRKTDDVELKKILENSWIDAENRFKKYIQKLSDVLFVGKKTGYLDDIISALILFKPSDIRNVERYAKYKVGAERFELYTILHPLLEYGGYLKISDAYIQTAEERMLSVIFGELPLTTFEFSSEKLLRELETENSPKSFFKPQTIKSLVQLLQNKEIEVELSKEDKKEIGQRFGGFSYDIMNFTSGTADNILSLINNFEFIAKKLNIKEILRYVLNATSCQTIELAIEIDDFNNLLYLYKKSSILQNYLRDEVLLYIREGWIFDEYMLSNGTQYTEKTLQNSNFWDFLEKIQLDDEVIDILNKQ